MRLFGICLVKNEVDVICQSLEYASKFCEKIYVLDNGSTDGTWETVVSLGTDNPRIVAFQQIFVKFSNDLRGIVYNEFHSALNDDDWWLLLDADEFLAEDPKPTILQANSEGADVINAWQALFYFTKSDLKDWNDGIDNRDKSIVERRRYYRIDEQERRLFQNRRSGDWATSSLLNRRKKFNRCVINRHYRYRDPPQIQARLELRYGQRAFATQAWTRDHTKMIRDQRGLTLYRDGDRWVFTLFGMVAFINSWIIPWRRELLERVSRIKVKHTMRFGKSKS